MPQGRFGRVALAALLIAAASASARAQDAPPFAAESDDDDVADSYVYATPADIANAPKQVAPEELAPPVDDATLAEALAGDPAEQASDPSIKAKSLRLPHAVYADADFKWDKTSNPDGTASYRVNKPLAAPWDAKIGADISTAPPPATDFRGLVTSSSAVPPQGASRAWANVVVPDFATVEVQAQPLPGRESVGTKLQRSIPVGSNLSVTMQGSFGLTEQRATTIGGAPVMSASLPGRSTSIFDSDKSLQLDIHSTGTTLLAGTTTATGDPIVHTRFSAAQKVYGPLNVTGTVSDVGQPVVNKSLTAGLKFDW